ncbi:HNH endonuclease [Candidatus Symbiobacter mobilis]|uniref:HNH nuclease n=1 Tax=Candidatus Symbiobacter mobilis CR TaxID=946483 RepID=U5N643_9BURK|nr:HNH endonuclease [Candidatus Symbiobacter mobilis]AGX86755.1 HNH nuclease [Candidatus Symbiobacter mobilis CR]
MREADTIFPDVPEFSAHLRILREVRLANKVTNENKRKKLTKKQRNIILEKTGGRCHICGGPIDGIWVAGHVFAHTYGGEHTLDNYLPAHRICNAAKWFYGTEELQWILKFGVYFRTQLEEIGNPDAISLAKCFLEHEKRRESRRKVPATMETA